MPYYSLTGEVTISMLGSTIDIYTTFNVRITCGWEYVDVKVSKKKYLHKLCGLCGFYNNDPADDFTDSSNTVVTNPDDFGFSWDVFNPAYP